MNTEKKSHATAVGPKWRYGPQRQRLRGVRVTKAEAARRKRSLIQEKGKHLVEPQRR